MASWLTGLAGKAEDLLNKVDQSAATALHKDELRKAALSSQGIPPATGSSDLKEIKISTDKTSKPTNFYSTLNSSVSVPSNLNKLNNVPPSGYASSAQLSRLALQKGESDKRSPQRGRKDADEELFEFLNSPESVAAAADNGAHKATRPENRTKLVGSLSASHSRHSSTSSTVSSHSQKQGASPADNFVFVSSTGDNGGHSNKTPEPSSKPSTPG
jgi:hypothetical protein